MDIPIVLTKLPRTPNLADTVTANLRANLERGVWAAGSQLPTEKSLSLQLGVSRSVVREAIAKLKHEGYLTTIQGKGAFVADDPGMATFRLDMLLSERPEDVDHVFEMRALIEQDCAALAAERRTAVDLRTMKQALRAMRLAQEAGGLGLTEDIAFHRAIAAATHNAVLARFADFVGKHHREFLQVTRLSALKSADRLADVDDEHDAVLAAIEARDADAAREAVQRHLRNGAKRVKRGRVEA
jgi:GntR family transcriptional regulator, transcriptional repressor for pyruvate dehydrogenase complex